MKKLLLPFLVILSQLLQGCGTASVNKPFQSAFSAYKEGQKSMAAGDYEDALNDFDRAALLLTNDGSPDGDYYRHGYYQFLAEIQSASAYAELLRGINQIGEGVSSVENPHLEKGKEKYRKTIMALRASSEQQRDLQLSDARFDRNVRFLLAAASTAAVAYGNSASSSSSGYNDAGADSALSSHFEALQSLVMDGYFDLPEVEDRFGERLPLAPSDHTVRMHVVPDQGVLRSIGRVVSDNGHCTGSVVYPRVVLTNQHCYAEKNMFFVEEHIYKPARKHRVIDVVLPAHSQDHGVRYDWMFLILDESARGIEPVPVETVGSLEDLVKEERAFLLSGYSADLDNALYQTVHLNCDIGVSIGDQHAQIKSSGVNNSEIDAFVRKYWSGGFNTDGQEMIALSFLQETWLHTCDSREGASGAPLIAFNFSDNMFSVVGINQGALKELPSNGILAGARLAVMSSAFSETLQSIIEGHPALNESVVK